MVDRQIDLKTIGFFTLVGLPYTLKFFIAPLMDRYPLPFLGRRRGQILITQIMLAFLFAAMSFFDPGIQLNWIAVIAVGVAIVSSMQDVVIDSYRREILSDRDLAMGSAMAINGYRIALLIAGAFALALADQVPWAKVYQIMALIMLSFTVFTFFSPLEDDKIKAPKSLREAVVAPLKDFFVKPYVWVILSFVLFFKLGDSMASALTTPFILKMGFSKTALAAVGKTFGMAATIAGGLLGGVYANRWGLFPALWVFGILQMVSTAFFPLLVYWPNEGVLALVVAFENLASGMGTSAYVAYMASLTNRSYTATQYAILSSLIGVPRTLFSSFSGLIAGDGRWTLFFLICAALAIPGLCLLYFLKTKIGNHHEKS